VSPAQLEIQVIAAVTAMGCSVVGVFLVLRRMAMLSDAISHSILLGIVVAFFIVEDTSSPLLVLAAAATGLLTVSLVELLHRTRLVREDAAIGLVFPALFSLGILLITRYAGNVHLDTDMVLLGELAFAPFERLVVGGTDIGPKHLYLMGGITLLNYLYVTIFFKEIKLATFDAGLAAALGFSPALIHYSLMALTSLTVVGAFDAVGLILVVALMVGPPAAAYLLTDRLPRMIALSAFFGVMAAVAGYWLAYWLDASIAGCIAVMVGVVFTIVFLIAPRRGLVAIARRRVRQKWEFARAMLTIHLFQHEGLPEAEQECRVDHLEEHLRWQPGFSERVVKSAQERGLIEQKGELLALTAHGRELAEQAIVR
jgi:manganese/zinc/iron transport system permease protein